MSLDVAVVVSRESFSRRRQTRVAYVAGLHISRASSWQTRLRFILVNVITYDRRDIDAIDKPLHVFLHRATDAALSLHRASAIIRSTPSRPHRTRVSEAIAAACVKKQIYTTRVSPCAQPSRPPPSHPRRPLRLAPARRLSFSTACLAVDRYSVGGSPHGERNRRVKFKNQLNVGYVNGYIDTVRCGAVLCRGVAIVM